MSKHCTKIIDTGPYRGLACKHTPGKCAHPKVCPECGKQYTVKSSYYSHMARNHALDTSESDTEADKPQLPPDSTLQVQKVEVIRVPLPDNTSFYGKEEELLREWDLRRTKHIELTKPQPEHTYEFRVDQQQQLKMVQDHCRKIEQEQRELRELDKLRTQEQATIAERVQKDIAKLREAEAKWRQEQEEQRLRDATDTKDSVMPIITQSMFNIDLSCFRSMGEDIYDGLVDKLGRDSALSYIMDIVGRKKPIDLFRKLYLEGTDRRMYPLVTKNSEMRYVDCRRMLVSDENGQMLAFLIQDSIQNALLKAASALIDSKLSYKDECSESNRYCDDFFEVQAAALDIKSRLPRTDVIKALKDWTDLPTAFHPFFENVMCVKAIAKQYLPTIEQATTAAEVASRFRK